MQPEHLSRYVFFGIFLLVIVLSIRIAAPFFGYIILAMILAYLLRRPYGFLVKKTAHERVSAALVLLGVLVLLIVPALFVAISLAVQAPRAVGAITDLLNSRLGDEGTYEVLGMTINVDAAIQHLSSVARNYLLDRFPTLVQSLAGAIIGLFVMFFCLYFLLKRGTELYADLKELIPLKRKYKTQLFLEMENVTGAVLYGQMLTAIVQGTLGGLGFAIAGIPNAIFWGFIMIILSLLPVLGPPVVWFPAVVYLFATHQLRPAIFLALWCFILVMNIDNLIKPRLIGSRTRLHPVMILIGVLGGLKLFGFIGLILGPIILSLLMVLLRLYTLDFHTPVEDRAV